MTASDQLRACIEELDALEPYPWTAFEAWRARAQPLFQVAYPDHMTEFRRVTTAPRWADVFYVSTEDPYTGERRDNFAEMNASKATLDRATAEGAKTTVLAFLRGVLRVAELAAATPLLRTEVFGLEALLDDLSRERCTRARVISEAERVLARVSEDSARRRGSHCIAVVRDADPPRVSHALRALARWVREILVSAVGPTGVEAREYAEFLRAAVDLDGVLACGEGLSLADVARRARMKRDVLHRCAALAYSDGFLRLVDVDEGLYAVMLEDDDGIAYHLERLSRGTVGLPYALQIGELVMGNHNATHVDRSTVGAVATGENAQAHGHVTTGTAPTQAEYVAALKRGQAALVDDQEVLDRLDGRLYEALGQFLRMAREIQVAQADLATVVARVKESVDEIWAKQGAEALRGTRLPQSLEVVKTLAANPLTLEIAKRLMGGG